MSTKHGVSCETNTTYLVRRSRVGQSYQRTSSAAQRAPVVSSARSLHASMMTFALLAADRRGRSFASFYRSLRCQSCQLMTMLLLLLLLLLAVTTNCCCVALCQLVLTLSTATAIIVLAVRTDTGTLYSLLLAFWRPCKVTQLHRSSPNGYIS